MMRSLSRIAAVLLLAACANFISVGSPALAQLPAPKPQQAAQPSQSQQPEQVGDQVRATLSQFGKFIQNSTYGEVWVPTVTPAGWHPYEPCHWFNTRQWGWYYDDRSPWGSIVHHYGRWKHDGQTGWMWIPGSEFSPGWVMWRTNPDWIGWIPTPPDEDVQNLPPDDFNTSGGWIFMDAKKFAQGCDGSVVSDPKEVAGILSQTRFVTEFDVEQGIAIAVLPPYIVGPVYDVQLTVAPWPAWFFAQTLIDWNFIWNNFDVPAAVLFADCDPQQAAQQNGSPQGGAGPQGPQQAAQVGGGNGPPNNPLGNLINAGLGGGGGFSGVCGNGAPLMQDGTCAGQPNLCWNGQPIVGGYCPPFVPIMCDDGIAARQERLRERECRRYVSRWLARKLTGHVPSL